ncbi:MAG: alpha/beta fold hydrolase [Pseudooceanicola nanhaiensis]|uniref:alpha/beta fold hydrolase n=1 Tax=Rhodobacterales TaxID=204455 RepID=UPI004058CC9A
MPKITANGISLMYEEAGEGTPLLLVSGLGQNRRAWLPALGQLTRRFRCITFDNRGTGASDVPEGPYSIPAMADDTAALIKALGLGPVDVAGWSLGGSVVQSLLIRHPSAVRSAALVSTMPCYSEVQHYWLDAWLALRRSGAAPLAQIVSAMAWGLTEKTLVDHAATMKLARSAAEDPEPTSLEGFEAQAAGLRIFDARRDLPKVQTPTLVLCGREDVLTPPSQSEEIAALIPSAELKLLPKGGHRMVAEYPDAVSEALLGFFARSNETA